jgi:hypothetical protein
MTTVSRPGDTPAGPERQRDAERTRREIIEVAIGEFARNGYSDIHLMISSFCFFRMSNRYSFGAIFGVDLLDASRREHYRQMAGDMVVSYLTTPSETS